MTAATDVRSQGTVAARSSVASLWPSDPVVLSEIALGLVAAASVLGLRRVFEGWSWAAPMAIHTVGAHVLVAAVRRRGLRPGAAAVVTAVAGALTIIWLHVGHLTTYGLPTASTISGLNALVADGLRSYRAVDAPSPAVAGLLAAAAVAVWAGAALADWVAFRADATIEAIIPGATLFGVGTVFGGDVGRIPFASAWVVAVLAFVALRRSTTVSRDAPWIGDGDRRGPRALAGAGITMALVIAVVAGLIAPRLPGASSDPVMSLTDIDDEQAGTRVTVSPLVDIRGRMVDQADVEVFQVRSTDRAYWRLTSLDRFDGRIWSSNGSYGKSSGDLDDGVPVASEKRLTDQQFTIAALSQIWLPAAYEPVSVEVVEPVRYDEVSGTLIVDTEVPTSDGASYGVTSELPRFTAAELESASRGIPRDIADRYLSLPPDFSPAVADLARSLTAGATSAYAAALDLQTFFRDNFTYDLSVGSGHSEDVVELFVLTARRGYCEQFAGSYAAMARSLGIPARVAVGFTPGLADPNEPGLFRVRGEHAHAWPELYLGEYGWVAFEPTPGRGAPGAEQYTGVPEQQVASGQDPTTASTVPVPEPTPDEVDPGGGDQGAGIDPGAATSTTSPDPSADPTTPPERSANLRWLWQLALGVLALAALVAVYAAAVLAVASRRHAARRRAASTPAAQVGVAWVESLESMAEIGVHVPSARTHRQSADVMAQRVPAVATGVVRLAELVEAATFSADLPDASIGRAALEIADGVAAATEATLTRWQVLSRRLHPRNLIPRRARR